MSQQVVKSNRRRGLLHLRWLAFGTAALLTAGGQGVAVASSHAQRPSATVSPLQEGLNFYRGQTISFVVPTPAGFGFDLEYRPVAEAMAAYLHASLKPENYPNGGGVQGEDILAASPANGLTFGVLEVASSAFQVALKQPGLNFNPEREVFIGSIPNPPFILVENGTERYASLEQLEHVAAPISVVIGTGTWSDLQLDLFFKALNNIPYRTITGYSGTSAVIAGWERGDGAFTYAGPGNGLAAFATANNGRILAVNSIEPASYFYHPILVGVPTFQSIFNKQKKQTPTEQLAMQYANDLGNIPQSALVMPAATKADRYLALRAAFEFAMRQPEVEASLNTNQIPRGSVSGFVSKDRYLTGLSVESKALRLISAQGANAAY